ncbi:MAG: hypothetical protein A2077_02835 [Nitrospirae bacterium GWC2_46_6]|nr:MAG: hypothetical protein A2077_02835 [Nitrospirae bacterium GWC2_46_6]OGW23091.1 MAG: hypothetical protein A2X55_08945 [Nitrospirae bacterium GWB2_47_37]HAK87638.1 hypothetical protein [Nitrospiraceae bacterium]
MSKAIVDTNILIRLIVQDDDLKKRACEKLLEKAKRHEVILYVLPVTILEIVWIMEKYYRLDKKSIKGFVVALLNTPDLKVEMEDVFRSAIEVYAEKNIKFADAVIAYWGMDKGLTAIYTYDERDFKRIEGLEVRKP